MNTQNYGKLDRGRRLKLRRRITGLVIAAVIILAAAFVIGKLTENSAEYQLRASLVEENRVLREQVADLQAQVEDLQGQVSERDAYIESIPTEAPSEEPSGEPDEAAATAEPVQPQTGTTPRSSVQ